MSVTTTSLRQGKFETRFWHKVFEEEVGRVKGHFGPINTYVNILEVVNKAHSLRGGIGLRSILQGYVMHLVERMGLFVCTTLMNPTSKPDHTATQRLLIKTGASLCICGATTDALATKVVR